ncbi:MAG: helix-turn-helix transcriptional regulator, partial [Phenylobacterium sp.]|nr:helix-turn-helix transcriptional regulator [Phenylobacterium sp.]
ASLSMIALACGFADQSHFTRVFTRRVGLSPGAWRKYLAG